MLNRFSRTQLIFGKDNIDKLTRAHIAVFGIGGVGGYVVEALARSGIGEFDLIDNDVFTLTNINRQIYANEKTLGKYKVDVAQSKIHDINPDAIVHIHKTFYLPNTASQFDFSQYDYVIDAIDTVTGKIEIILQAKKYNVPVISCMGTGNKVDPTMLEVADIYKTSVCPLAKVMRNELRKRGVEKLKVVYSKEKPVSPIYTDEVREQNPGGRHAPGSTSFVPSVAGLIIAGEVIKDITGFKNINR